MKKYLLPVLVFVFVLHSSMLVSQTKTIPYQQLPTWSGSPTGSNMFFGATISSTGITVTFEGPSNKWIAIGFGNFMNPADVLMYSNGPSSGIHPLGWNDYHNTSSGSVIDGTQNWNIISNTVASGQRTVVASRVLNTGDANDVVFTYSSTALNLIWARNSTNDYTVAYHGTTNRAYSISLPWLSPPTASFSVPTTTICAGSSVTFSNTSTGGQTTYTWGFQGGTPAISTVTNPVITFTAPGIYSVSLVATNAVGSNTNTQTNYITVTPTVAPAVSIAQSAGTNPMCAGASVTFSASPLNGGNSPSFQWKVNGSNVGTNNPSFSSSSLPGSASITCVMISNAPCSTPSTSTSAPITMTIFSTAPASISVVQSSGNNPTCVGAVVGFSATPGNGGSSPFYQWKINGINVGNNSPTFTTNTLNNGDAVTCILNSNSPCASSTVATSPAITMTVSSILSPSVLVTVTGGSNPSCTGNLLTFSSTPANGGSAPAFQWKVNGVNSGSNAPTFSSTSLPNGATVTCVMLSNLVCSNPNTATSSAIVLTVNPIPPAPAITAVGSTTFCAGDSIKLMSSASFGNHWSTGATTSFIFVTGAGNFSVAQTVNNCTSAPSSLTPVFVNPLPQVNLGTFAAICVSEILVLNQGQPAGGIYSGNFVSGTTFSVPAGSSGFFNIKYTYTDVNGCANSATSPVNVSECVGISPVQTANNLITVFPNPGTGHFSVFSGNTGIRSYTVRDLNGNLILDSRVDDQKNITVDISAQPHGIYLLELFSENGPVRSLIYKND